MSFGNKLKQLRKQYRLTQQQMSEKLLMEQSNYSHYETDKTIPTADIIMRVAQTFNVTLDWLMQPDGNQINFESGSINQGAVINNGTNYSIPKEVLDMLLSQQKMMVELLQKLIEKP
jgi:transcriptional regulator with XRE-family HTH domain